MIIVANLLIIDHLISVSITLLYLPLVFRHLNSLFNLKIKQVHLTTQCCV